MSCPSSFAPWLDSQVSEQRVEAKRVARRPEAEHLADGRAGGDELVPVLLAAVDVGEVDLDGGQAHRVESVANREASVRVGARVHEDALAAAARPLDVADDLALAVRLHRFDLDAGGSSLRRQRGIDLRES